MAKRILITSGLFLVLAVAAVMWSTRHPIEPVYQGKTLSQWLEGHVPNSSANPPYNSAGWTQADEALRHIGASGIPTLVKMIAAKDPPPPIFKFLQRLRSRGWIKSKYRYALQRNEEAEYAFEILGTNAAPAVPDLIRIYKANRSLSSQRCTALALGHIGPPASAAVPVLLKDFHHPSSDTRYYAVSATYGIGGDPGIVVPALTSVLNDPRLDVRWNAIVALGNFGSRARSAVPQLLEALKDPGMLGAQPIKQQVEIALWRIAPEKIAKTLVVEASTPIIADGIITEAVDLVFKGERRTIIPAGKSVPCTGSSWNSEPLGPLTLYRTNRTTLQDHCLGTFEVIGLAPSQTRINAQVLCVVADQQIVLCARDYTHNRFLELRRLDGESTR